jgi:G3E family GTPase
MNDTPPRVTVLGGFSPAATEALARVLLVADPTLTLLGYDLGGLRDGVVGRTVRTAGAVRETGHTRLVHGCVSCTLREDVLPTLVRLSRGGDIVLALPPAVEPALVAAAVAGDAAVRDAVRFDSYVTVVEAATFLDDLTGTAGLRDRDLHAAGNDRRLVAEVVARQVEFADTLVVWDRPGHDAYEAGRLDALLHRLAPWAVHVRVGETPAVDCTALAARLLRTGRHDPATPGMLGRTLSGFPIGIHDPAGAYGCQALLFRSRRPFHPARLHLALEDISGETLRGRGQLWIASQPDTVIGWESAGGGIRLGALGRWLAALPTARWHEASDLRRLAADLDWDPYYGDRQTVLSFVGLGLDVTGVTRRLAACLLTDAELADGADGWGRLPDPFAGYFPLAAAPGR